MLNLMCGNSEPKCSFSKVTADESSDEGNPSANSTGWHCIKSCPDVSISLYTGSIGCISRRKKGSACLLSSACLSGSCSWFTCSEQAKIGEECQDHFNCESGLCIDEECVAPIPLGGSCDASTASGCEDSACSVSLGQCIEVLPTGGACSSPDTGANVGCFSGYCKGGTCSLPDPIGSDCVAHAGCTSGYCPADTSTCTAQVEAGEPCVEDAQCASGLCDSIGGVDRCTFPTPSRRLDELPGDQRYVHVPAEHAGVDSSLFHLHGPHVRMLAPRPHRSMYLDVYTAYGTLLGHAGLVARRLGVDAMAHAAVRVTHLKPHMTRRNKFWAREAVMMTVGQARAPNAWVAHEAWVTDGSTPHVHSGAATEGDTATAAGGTTLVRDGHAAWRGTRDGSHIHLGSVGPLDALLIELVLLPTRHTRRLFAEGEVGSEDDAMVPVTVGVELLHMAFYHVAGRDCAATGCEDHMTLDDPVRHRHAVDMSASPAYAHLHRDLQYPNATAGLRSTLRAPARPHATSPEWYRRLLEERGTRDHAMDAMGTAAAHQRHQHDEGARHGGHGTDSVGSDRHGTFEHNFGAVDVRLWHR